ncbi:hypothetical protein KGF56_002792 [Candida oxycetoniae]|uniref:Skg3/CAF120-like PH-like domain-containing protein n=1 Tax=Candida oxycetoniae TaxID=497107 RepID=A0AAI9WY26_9ASCO|nr:uncharacterized protein KGF56_002792 [Candida oxycetoniae]KAI3404395.2 hypothetical protein KGF56_002792 [Candida oxycetoniae]
MAFSILSPKKLRREKNKPVSASSSSSGIESSLSQGATKSNQIFTTDCNFAANNSTTLQPNYNSQNTIRYDDDDDDAGLVTPPEFATVPRGSEGGGGNNIGYVSGAAAADAGAAVGGNNIGYVSGAAAAGAGAGAAAGGITPSQSQPIRARSPLSQPPTTAFDEQILDPLPKNHQLQLQSQKPNSNYTTDNKNVPAYTLLAHSDNSSSSTDSANKNSSSLLPKLNSFVSSDAASEVSSVCDQFSLQSPTYNNSPRQRHLQKLSDTFNDSPRRTLSERAKITPSAFVRQSIYFSNDANNGLDFETASINSMSGRSLLLQNKMEVENLSPEFRPIVTLLNAQRLRSYCHGSFQVPGFIGNERIWFEVDAKLSGNELAIWRPSNDDYIIDDIDEFKPKYINLIDARIENLGGLEIRIFQDYREDKNVLIKFHNSTDLNKWISAIILAKFEYVKLNEAFTAVLLSLRGSKLSDIHVLLSHKKRFPQYEWCNIRLPEVSSKWIKVFMVILPSDKHHLGRIEFYPSDKKVHKKYLVAYISDLAYLFNVYPEQAHLIDFNSIMNACGKVYVGKKFEHLFPYEDPRKLIAKNHSMSRSGSNNSLSSLTEKVPAGGATPTNTNNTATRSRSSSVNSTNSFFSHSPASSMTYTRERSESTPVASAKRLSKSTSQFDLNKTNSSFFKKHAEEFVSTNTMYIMPVPHPGVSAVETMMRNFIPIIDAFKLYGRPHRLISDKTNAESMLFGLPFLPHYQYLSTRDAEEAFSINFHNSMNESQMEKILKDKISELQSRSKPYRGHGNIGQLYEKLDLSFDEITSPVLSPKLGDDLPSLGEPIALGRIASPLSV